MPPEAKMRMRNMGKLVTCLLLCDFTVSQKLTWGQSLFVPMFMRLLSHFTKLCVLCWPLWTVVTRGFLLCLWVWPTMLFTNGVAWAHLSSLYATINTTKLLSYLDISVMPDTVSPFEGKTCFFKKYFLHSFHLCLAD